jgi:hypothetical protein
MKWTDCLGTIWERAKNALRWYDTANEPNWWELP